MNWPKAFILSIIWIGSLIAIEAVSPVILIATVIVTIVIVEAD